MRSYVDSELAPWAQEWENAEEIPSKVYSHRISCSLSQAYKRHAEVGCIAATLPSKKLAKYIKQTSVRLPANIPIEDWDPFHQFIVQPSSYNADSRSAMNLQDSGISG